MVSASDVYLADTFHLMKYPFEGWMGEEKSLFRVITCLNQDSEKRVLKDTPPDGPPVQSLFSLPEGFPALIHEKRTLFIWNFLNSRSIGLSRAIQAQKMAVFSTNYEAEPDPSWIGVEGWRF